jgi:hypothetical protein
MIRSATAAATLLLSVVALPAFAGSAWDQPRSSAYRSYDRHHARVGMTVEGPLVDGAVVSRRSYRHSYDPVPTYGFSNDDHGRSSVVVTRERITRLDPDGRGYEPVLETVPSYVPRPFEYVPARRLVLPGSLADGTILPANVYLDGYRSYRGYGGYRERSVEVDARSRTVVRVID